MVELFEVPGEVSPMDQPNVLNALVLAASAVQQQVQTGTKQLQHWEKQKMYYPTLQVISKHWVRKRPRAVKLTFCCLEYLR